MVSRSVRKCRVVVGVSSVGVDVGEGEEEMMGGGEVGEKRPE